MTEPDYALDDVRACLDRLERRKVFGKYWSRRESSRRYVSAADRDVTLVEECGVVAFRKRLRRRYA
ncbi:MAG: hypothetical protein JOY66_09250 [Acetobacteraceae bacterium]|nr:hypothetical protein [Acetobacteraceae bacterium]